jgi:hypothetical protein
MSFDTKRLWLRYIFVSFLKQLKLNTMKKAKLTLIVFVMALLAVACKKEDNSPKPVAGFNITSNDTLNIDQERFNSPIHLNRCNILYLGILADGTTATTVNATKNI